MTAAAGILADADGAGTPSAGGASAEELLARALEVIEQQSVRIDDLARQNAELREQNAQLAGASEELGRAEDCADAMHLGVFGRALLQKAKIAFTENVKAFLKGYVPGP